MPRKSTLSLKPSVVRSIFDGTYVPESEDESSSDSSIGVDEDTLRRIMRGRYVINREDNSIEDASPRNSSPAFSSICGGGYGSDYDSDEDRSGRQGLSVDLEPLPEMDFKSLDELLESAKQFALDHGYSIVKSRTGKRVVRLCCDISTEGPGSRFVGCSIFNTKKIDCPFSARANRVNERCWRLQVVYGRHNHREFRPAGCKMLREEVERATELLRTNPDVERVLTYLRIEFPFIHADIQDIKNLSQKVRMRALGGGTDSEYLLGQLERIGWKHDHVLDDTNTIDRVVFAHQESIELANRYGAVFIVDCVDIENVYGMSLLHLTCYDANDTTFSVGFAYIKKKTTEIYTWALRNMFSWLERPESPPVIFSNGDTALMDAIEAVYPESHQMLFIWQVFQKITTHATNHFKKYTSATARQRRLAASTNSDLPIGPDTTEINTATHVDAVTDSSNEPYDAKSAARSLLVPFLSKIQILLAAPTIADYDERLLELRNEYGIHENLLARLDQEWLAHREKFVTAWTRNYLHLDAGVSSRRKGAQFEVKRDLNIKEATFYDLLKVIMIVLKNQVEKVSQNESLGASGIPFYAFSPPLNKVKYRVTHHCMRLVHDQVLKVLSENKSGNVSDCTGIWRSTHGLPCSHMLRRYVEENTPIELCDISKFYHLKKILVWEVPPAPRLTNTSVSRPNKRPNTGSASHNVQVPANNESSGSNNRLESTSVVPNIASPTVAPLDTTLPVTVQPAIASAVIAPPDTTPPGTAPPIIAPTSASHP